MATHVFTSAASNYLPKARVLAHSLRRFHPDWKIHLVLCDVPPPSFSPAQEPFDSVLALSDLEIPNLKSWLFQHTLVELSTAVKGFALTAILSFENCDRVLYFDPDIVILSPLDRLISEFDEASILLTPHLSEPETTRQAIVDNELSVLQHGIYNLGFIGVKNSEEGRRFASWWSERLEAFCWNDIPRGLFTDQRWADLIPAYFSEYAVLRDPVYNVSTWNLTHRAVTGSIADGLFVNGVPIAFYHFSGFDSGAQAGMLNRYGSQMPALFELRDWYIASCERMGQETLSLLPWSYDFFDNGEPILPFQRRRYRESPSLQSLFPDPFAVSEKTDSYLTWFGFHDGSRNQIGPFKNSVETEPLLRPDYRIVLIAARDDVNYLGETANRILAASVLRSNFFVLISAGSDLQTIRPEFEVIEIEAYRYSDLFIAALERFADKDLLVVRAGAFPPVAWDVRLAWSAARQSGALSVAPLDRRTLDPSNTLGSFDDEALDRYCYWYRGATDLESASMAYDCVYIRAAALRDVLDSRKTVSSAELAARVARLRYSNLLATHVCVGWRSPRDNANPLELASSGSWSLKQLRDTLRTHFVEPQTFLIPAVTPGTLPVLHLTHNWGGGVEGWLRDFADADSVNSHLVLKSQGPRGAYGSEIGLYRYGYREPYPELLKTWNIDPVIKATAVKNESYESALREIYHEYGFESVLVSSLIGHSLECLNLPVPTALVCHDYYPFCSAVNLTFGEVCQSCERPRLAACIESNPLNSSFPNVPVPEWLSIRSEFVRAMKQRGIPMIAPSPSVKRNYSRALPELAGLFQVIPHGTRPLPCKTTASTYEPESRLRILILGSLAVHKGRLLLEALLPELLRFADLTLAGCFDFAAEFLSNPKIRVVPSYDRETLCDLIEEIRPEVGLLLSIVPETFSYTLRELQSLGIPPVATRIGSFVDWIEDGETGFLCDPQPRALLDLLQRLQADKAPLQTVHQNLKLLPLRSPEAMVQDYRKLAEPQYSPTRYFGGPSAPSPLQGRDLQLYWRTTEVGFSEEDSMAVLPLGPLRQRARLYFAAPAATVIQLRLDLATQPGFFVLHGITLFGGKDEVLWSLSQDPTSITPDRLAQCFVLERGLPDRGILFCLIGGDPFILLPIPLESLAQSHGVGSIEVDFTPDVQFDRLSMLVHAAHDYEIAGAQIEAARNELETRARQLSEKEEQLRQDADELKRRHEALNSLRNLGNR